MAMQQQQQTTPTVSAATGNGSQTSASPINVTSDDQTFVEAALLRSVPRRVRASRQIRKMRLIGWNFILGYIVGAVYFLSHTETKNYKFYGFFLLVCVTYLLFCLCKREYKRVRQARLLRNGVAVMGTVTLDSSGANTLDMTIVRYRYQPFGEAERMRTVNVPLSVAGKFTPGRKCTILYNPVEPGESYPYAAMTDAEIE